MTRAEARRRQEGGVPGTDENGPDPTEDPVLYLEDEDRQEGEKEKWTSGS